MQEYFKVRIVDTKGGRIGATINSALLAEMPQDSIKKSPSTTISIKWFSTRKEAIMYAKDIRKANDWSY